MRIIKKELWSAAFLITGLLFFSEGYAEDEGCPAGPNCAPCGYVAAEASALPSDAIGVNPLINYAATADSIRCRGYFSGFYVGAAYGGGGVNYHLQVGGATPAPLVFVFPFPPPIPPLTPTILVPPAPPISGIDSDNRSYLVTIFDAGFNLVIDHFLLGAEVGYNYRSRVDPITYYDQISQIIATSDGVTAASSPCKIRLDINSQHAVTGDLLPGIVYQRFIAYLRLGVEEANFNWQRRVCFPAVSVNTLTADDVTTVQEGEFIDTKSKNASGYRLGAGFGFAAGPHVSFHLNYIHTFYNKITFTPDITAIQANVPVLTTGAPTVVTSNLTFLAANNVIEPQRDEVNFGVKFRF